MTSIYYTVGKELKSTRYQSGILILKWILDSFKDLNWYGTLGQSLRVAAQYWLSGQQYHPGYGQQPLWHLVSTKN